MLSLIFAALGLFGFSVLCTSMCSRGPREVAVPRCANNLRQIALASIMYANADPQGRFPPTINDILLTQDITSDVFVCPQSNDSRATGPTAQAAATNLTAGGHLSYVYLGNGLTNKSDSETVLAYEAQTYHGPFRNFVYADAHVETQNQTTTAKILAELAAGHNPPRPDRLK